MVCTPDGDLIGVEIVTALVSKIAHKINNDFMAIAIHAQLLSGRADDADALASLDDILQTCKRGSEWVDALNAAMKRDVRAALSELLAAKK